MYVIKIKGTPTLLANVDKDGHSSWVDSRAKQFAPLLFAFAKDAEAMIARDLQGLGFECICAPASFVVLSLHKDRLDS